MMSGTAESIRIMASLFHVRTNVLLFLQCIPGSVPWGVLFVFLNDFLAQDKGLSVAKATLIISIFGVGAAVGGIAGGIVGQKVYNKYSPSALPLLMATAQVVAVPFMCAVVRSNYEAAWMPLILPTIFVTGAVASIAGTNVRFILINVNHPTTRGAAMSILSLFNNVGRGIGPVIVSIFVRYFHERESGFVAATYCWGVSGILMGGMYLTVEADERRASQETKSG